jgi:hypothetical protein
MPSHARPAWSAQEKRVIDRYARALKRGRYRTVREGASEYLHDLERLRKRYPGARWLKVHRTYGAVSGVLVVRARKVGRVRARRWTRGEDRLIHRYALRVAEGRIPNPWQATNQIVPELDRLRARYPLLPWLQIRRTRKAYFNRIWAKARELGRPYTILPWSPPERLILQRYARRVLSGELPSARHAAHAALKDIESLHRKHPNARWGNVRRTFKATGQMIAQEAHILGQAWALAHWTPSEEKLLDKHARAVIAGKASRVEDAARKCWAELERRHKRRLRRNPRLPRTPQPRSLDSTGRMIRGRIFQLFGRQRATPWTKPEAEIALRWAASYKSYKHTRDGAELQRVIHGLMDDLKQHGFARDATMCRNRLFRILEGKTYLPAPRPGRPR